MPTIRHVNSFKSMLITVIIADIYMIIHAIVLSLSEIYMDIWHVTAVILSPAFLFPVI